MMLGEEDITRMVLEVIYRNKKSLGNHLSIENIRMILELTEKNADQAISTLEEKGYVEQKNGEITLTNNGFIVLNQREISFCPYL